MKTNSTDVTGKPKQIELEAVVHRIVHDRGCFIFDDGPCSCASTKVEAVPLGVVSYYHRSPLKRWWWEFRNRNKEGRAQR